MRWSERQRAMLREMGIPPFWPVEAEVVDAAPQAPAIQQGPQASSNEPIAAEGAVLAMPAAGLAADRAAPPRPMPAKPQPVAVAELLDATPRPARPAGVESMDWPALRDAVAGCLACGLCESRKQTVFGVGNIEAEWMIVGEAPGEEEDRQGAPFVGRAGQLLDRMLASIDLTRSDDVAARQVFIANVLKCRPPANRNPLPQEVAQCEPYLLRQMALVRPKVILAMGRFAVQSLLKTTDAIGRLRGRVHEVQGIPVVVTYHPAYLLRNQPDKAKAWEDLCFARKTMRALQDGA